MARTSIMLALAGSMLAACASHAPSPTPEGRRSRSASPRPTWSRCPSSTAPAGRFAGATRRSSPARQRATCERCGCARATACRRSAAGRARGQRRACLGRAREGRARPVERGTRRSRERPRGGARRGEDRAVHLRPRRGRSSRTTPSPSSSTTRPRRPGGAPWRRRRWPNRACARCASGIDEATAALGEAQVTLGYAEITAPFAGRVLERRVDPGTLASPGTPLLVLSDEEAPARRGRGRGVVPGSA